MKKISFLAFFLLATLIGVAQHANSQSSKPAAEPMVRIVTTQGKIVVRLYNDTPLHRDNFLKLVANHTYDSLLFHRVIPNFMVQGGDPNSRNAKPGARLGDGSLGYTIPAEFRPQHFHKRGALCAARMGDAVNPKKESSASQFYIVQGQKWTEQQLDMMQSRFGRTFSLEQRKAYTTVGGTPHLDGDYTVFGEVLEGLDVVERICNAQRDGADRPLTDIRIIKMEVIK